MVAPYPLNQAVITQALHDLHNGQLRHCLAMGFGERELEALKQPALAALLMNARVPWCTVKVNRETFRRLIGQADDVAREIGVVDRMLRLGASTEMICKYHGLTHQEIALRREIIGQPGRKAAIMRSMRNRKTGCGGPGSPPSPTAASPWTMRWRCWPWRRIWPSRWPRH